MTKKQALKKMERDMAQLAGVPPSNRPQFVGWYRKTLDYRWRSFRIALGFFLRGKK